MLNICRVEVNDKVRSCTRYTIKIIGMLYLKCSCKYIRLADADGLN